MQPAPRPPECVLVMPAYNEEGCIEAVVSGWLEEFARQFPGGFRVIVVNDGSRDATGAILDRLAARVRNLQVVHQKNSGHGAAVRRGYEEALALDAPWVFQVDSDDQFKPVDFDRLWTRRRESPFIIGHRRNRHDALHRLVITRILRLVLWGFFGVYIKDSNVPFRLLRRDFLQGALGLIEPTAFAPNIFITVVAARLGYPLLHIPVTHEDRKTGTVSIVRWKLLKVCARCVRELFAFRLVLRRQLPALRVSLANSAGERAR